MQRGTCSFAIEGVDGYDFRMEVDNAFHSGRKQSSPDFSVFKTESIAGGAKSTRKKMVVVTGKIIKGEIATNTKVVIILPNRTMIEDEVLRIEVRYKEVGYAVANEEVGICLKKIRLRDIRRASSS